MEKSRVKNIDLAKEIDAGQIEWFRTITPISNYYCRQIEQRDYRGKRFAYWGHITRQNTLSMILALKQAGAEVAMGACNVDSTDDAAAAYAAAQGVYVYGWRGMTLNDYRENLAIIRSFEADYLCDMGGEVCAAYVDKTPPVKGAMEATTSGLHVLKNLHLPFPVFNWNDIPLKYLHNRYHVGDSIWPAFSFITSMSLYGRRVLVVGFGPVGKGIAERARDLGAMVYVTDLDPVRLVEARHLGLEPVELQEGLEHCQIIVTATGVEGILRRDQLSRLLPGSIIFNAGHSNHEIDIEWLYRQSHQRIVPHIERFDLEKTHLYLLGQGSLLNLSAGMPPHGQDQFDLYTAVMLLGTAWMFDGIPEEIQPGLQRFPIHLEREIAALSLKVYGKLG